MKFGTGFPITASTDLGAIRDFAQTLDAAGIDFLTTSGHVLGAPADRYTDRGNGTYVGPFYDPFVLFSYLAGITERIQFLTSILILPLYPTALLAKQAAELSFVSGGRFNLGAGISWHEAEYKALGQDLHTRGRRLEEQIRVLRLLWKDPFVTFSGRFHEIDGVGLNRAPVEIPLWIGCNPEEKLLRRVARLADGWLPLGDPTAALPRLHEYLVEAGRDPAQFQVMGRLNIGAGDASDWIETATRLQTLGVTHLSIGLPQGDQETALKKLIEARNTVNLGLDG